ncbi:FabD/lysophospholipase-like protein [Decorospora gaudefroyi]|uniref:FabD/lysophospholipase-like protein n=1 Tax=Decorospora gaudefroyi TaxID=184978 RepID=A0A6A5KSA7_9PLEO|nr:FabD/lysophospholipase-like protein [Decorospora gaudefroyi]
MSWTPVDFSCVRYSPVEGTHYFHDPTYPCSIQFLLSGRWESWDVSYVKYRAQDPEIRRVAERAENQLVRDSCSGYAPWPSPPPSSTGPLVNEQVSPQSIVRHSPVAGQVPLSPFREAEQFDPALFQNACSPESAAYNVSPYGRLPPIHDDSVQTSVKPIRPVQEATLDKEHELHRNAHPPAPHPAHMEPHPDFQPASTGAILSRTRETKVLLSIDGDGIRGLSALLVVESLVNAICVKVGQRLDSHQIFDLTGGCSLGGIIAIMLCRLRMQAHRAREAYKQISKQVYLNKRDYFKYLDPHVPARPVDDTALEQEIKAVIRQELGNEDELLFDGRPDSGDVFAITTQMDVGTNKAALIRSYQTRRITGPDLEPNMTIWQAMKATSTAPRYVQSCTNLPHRFVIEKGLVDHGTAKNNPVRDILYECRKLFRYANDMMIIVSVGTGTDVNLNTHTAMAHSVAERAAEAASWGSKFELEHAPLMDRQWMKFFRFNVSGLEDVPLQEWECEALVREKTSVYLEQPEVGRRFYACVDAITGLLLGPQGR